MILLDLRSGIGQQAAAEALQVRPGDDIQHAPQTTNNKALQTPDQGHLATRDRQDCQGRHRDNQRLLRICANANCRIPAKTAHKCTVKAKVTGCRCVRGALGSVIQCKVHMDFCSKDCRNSKLVKKKQTSLHSIDFTICTFLQFSKANLLQSTKQNCW